MPFTARDANEVIQRWREEELEWDCILRRQDIIGGILELTERRNSSPSVRGTITAAHMIKKEGNIAVTLEDGRVEKLQIYDTPMVKQDEIAFFWVDNGELRGEGKIILKLPPTPK